MIAARTTRTRARPAPAAAAPSVTLAAALAHAEQTLFSQEGMARFLDTWWAYLARQGSLPDALEEMRSRNPVCIPRNHRVEAALAQAEREGKYDLFRELIQVLANPYREVLPAYREPPLEHERVRQTFCGT